jgi:hypothetical protein
MKDYSKQKVEQNSKKPNTSQYRNEDLLSRSNNYSAVTNRLKLETNNIYKGMPYDEWTKIYEEFVKKWITSPVQKRFVFGNEIQIQESIIKQKNSFSDDHVYITPTGKYGVLEFDLNDNEFFLEYETLDKYFDWCKKEKIRVSKNKFCNSCEYYGSCLSEHLREVKSLDNSCNGFKLLLDWYDERLANKTRTVSSDS